MPRKNRRNKNSQASRPKAKSIKFNPSEIESEKKHFTENADNIGDIDECISDDAKLNNKILPSDEDHLIKESKSCDTTLGTSQQDDIIMDKSENVDIIRTFLYNIFLFFSKNFS